MTYIDPRENAPDAVLTALDDAMLHKDFVDNVCIACSTNDVQMNQYEAQRAGGCCGFVDESITIDGVEWYFGFNYGH